MRKFLLNLFLLLSSVGLAGAQTITTTDLNAAETGSPLIGGSTNNIVVAFSVSKTAGGATDFTNLVISSGATNPNTVFSSVQLFSSNGGFGSATNTGATPTLNAGNITFAGTPIRAFGAGAESRNFYVVATVIAGVSTTSGGIPSISLSFDQTNTTYSATPTENAFSVSYASIEFEGLMLDLTQAAGGIPSSVTAGATNQAILGFSAVTNGTQSLDDLVFTPDVNPMTGPLSGFQLVNNGASSTYSGGGSVLGTVPSLTATTVTFNNVAQALTSSPTYFFLIADVSGAATPQNFNTTFTNATADVAGASGFGFDEGPIAIAPLTTTFAPLSGGLATSPLVEGDTEQAILGFSATSNGSSSLTAISFPITPTGVDLTDYFGSIKLYASTNATFGGSDAEIVDAGGYNVDLSDPTKIIITNLAQTITSTTKNYFLVADIESDIAAVRGNKLAVSLPASEITVTGSKSVSSTIESANYKFLYAQSSIISVNNGGQGSLDITDYVYQGPLNSTVMGERIFSVDVDDADPDSRPTKITSLTFEFGDPQNLDSVALFVSGTTAPLVRAKVATTIDGNDRITFNFTPPAADATDDGTKTYEIFVSFVDTVYDNDVISVKLYAAVADTTQGSGLAAFGTLQTSAGNNDIDVVASIVQFDPSTITAITPNTGFPVTAYATDIHNNVDVNFNEKAEITASGGSGSISGGGLIDPVNGVYFFPALSIDAAGNYILTANDNTGGVNLTADTSPIVVNSLGVKITNGSSNPLDRDLCFGLKTYDSLGTIKIQEQDRGDFVSGGFYMFELPPGFVFNTAKAPTITEAGNEVTLNPFGTTSGYYVGNNIFRFRFTITGTTDPIKDAIAIKGLEIMPDSTYTGIAGGDLYARDAGSVMVGNAEADSLTHGTINLVNASAVNFDFQVAAFPGQTAIVPEETQFSYTTFGVLLKPSPTNPPSSYPVFQGNGISKSSTQNAYVFSPSAVGVGNNYIVSFTTRQTSTGCKVTKTKTFTVYATSITNLLPEYCENDDITPALNVPKDRYGSGKYYPNWVSTTNYTVGTLVNYGGDAFECINPLNLGIAPTNATKWKMLGYKFTGDYSISIPSYKTITTVDNNGAGAITITAPNHGFTAGSKLYLGYYVYDANWNVIFNIPYPSGDTTTYYQISNVTANTFQISYNHPATGIYGNGYGSIYIRNPQVTGVTHLNKVVTVTVPNHGLIDGAKVEVYLEGLSGNDTSNYIGDYYAVNVIDKNTFTMTTAQNVTGIWNGYGYVNIFNYKISSFNPSEVSSLNSNFGSITTIYVGFFVKNVRCVTTATNTCVPFIYSSEPVKLNQLADLDFDGLNPTGAYCASATAVNLIGNQVDGSFTPGNGVTDGGANNNTATFLPSSGSITQGTQFPITYTFTDNKNCTATISKMAIVNVTPTRPDLIQAQFGYCVGDTQPLILKVGGTGTEFAWYNNASKTTLVGNGPVLDASSEGSGSPKTVSFFATRFSLGCESGTRQVDLVINQPPDADFTNLGQCAKDTITFKGSRTNIAAWDWDFGDGTLHGADSTVTHIYEESRTFSVRLTVKSTTLSGNVTCTNSSVINLFVGFNPAIDVKYQRICDGDDTEFTYTSSPPLDKVSWDFGDGTEIAGPVAGNISSVPRTTGKFGNPEHAYLTAGSYTAIMVGTTSIGCSDTIRKVVPILEKLSPTSALPYLMKTAMPAGESGFWQVETTIDSTSTWEFNVLTGTTMQAADSAWVTGASTFYKSNDVSYVNSPCFDITGFDRPLISMNYMKDTQNGRDGAILEYSTNSGTTWIKLGNPNTGLEWYDQPNPVNALGNVFGWTGKDTIFQAGFHSLSGIPFGQRDNVRFRIKFASDQDTESEGFAFNGVNIVEKNRLVLVENFTNNSKSETVNHNTIFRNLSTYLSESEYVPLEYHIVPAGFSDDPINELNKADNNARAAFYGITQNVTGSQDGILMGMFNTIPASTNLKQAFEDEFNLRSLRSSPVELDIVTSNTASDQYKIDVTLRPTEDINTTEPIALYIALVEKVLDDPALQGENGETQYRYVLRKMLPSAAGKRLIFPLAMNIPVTFTETITITDNLFHDVNEMAVIAFIQNQNIDNDGRKDVWQAAIEKAPLQPATVTGMEPSFGDLVNIYPVPSRGKMNIELPEKVKRTLPMNLIDNFGREVYANQFKLGERVKTIDTREFADGVYILQIMSEKGKLFRRKVVITND